MYLYGKSAEDGIDIAFHEYIDDIIRLFLLHFVVAEGVIPHAFIPCGVEAFGEDIVKL